ncbi:unnamed protein product, partial [Protopolystoma xenopodis]
MARSRRRSFFSHGFGHDTLKKLCYFALPDPLPSQLAPRSTPVSTSLLMPSVPFATSSAASPSHGNFAYMNTLGSSQLDCPGQMQGQSCDQQLLQVGLPAHTHTHTHIRAHTQAHTRVQHRHNHQQHPQCQETLCAFAHQYSNQPQAEVHTNCHSHHHHHYHAQQQLPCKQQQQRQQHIHSQHYKQQALLLSNSSVPLPVYLTGNCATALVGSPRSSRAVTGNSKSAVSANGFTTSGSSGTLGPCQGAALAAALLGGSPGGAGGAGCNGSAGGIGTSPSGTAGLAVNYELSEDLRAKEIAFIERCYGGRIRAQRAARLIQTTYRDYRLRREYSRIRAEKRTAGTRRPGVRGPASPSCCPACSIGVYSQPAVASNIVGGCHDSHLAPMASSVADGSLEDLVINRAYFDWQLGPEGYANPESGHSTLPTKASVNGTLPLFSGPVSSSNDTLRPELEFPGTLQSDETLCQAIAPPLSISSDLKSNHPWQSDSTAQTTATSGVGTTPTSVSLSNALASPAAARDSGISSFVSGFASSSPGSSSSNSSSCSASSSLVSSFAAVFPIVDGVNSIATNGATSTATVTCHTKHYDRGSHSC